MFVRILFLLLLAGPVLAQSLGVAAIVNGDVVTTADVDNRRRLFAVSAGLQPSPEVLARLGPQVLRQIIDDRLRLQEAQRRRIAVSDDEVASAISDIERRNNMPSGGLRARMGAASVSYRTLVEQIRVQILWLKTLRQIAGNQGEPSAEEVAERIRTIQAQAGRTEYRVAEIFVPVDDPSKEGEVRAVVDDIIAQLRRGAPFPVVAAQFSQSQSSLQGGDLGWLQEGDLDPEVARIVTRMPERAISNPVRVAGGFSIVTLLAKRIVVQAAAPPPAAAGGGGGSITLLSIRQVFIPFERPLQPNTEPTPQQRAAVERADRIVGSVRSCDAMEAANREAGGARPANPGEIPLERQQAGLRQFLAQLRPGQPRRAIASDGVLVIMLCSRETRSLEQRPAAPPPEAAEPPPASREAVAQLIQRERLDTLSRQLLRDLRRRADIRIRAG